jgi:hypothetical protein
MKDRKFLNSHGPDCVLTLVDPDDISAFVAAAFDNAKKNMRVDDVLRKLGEASGRPIDIIYRTPEETEKDKSNPCIAGHLLCIDLDKYADMEEVLSWGVPLTSFAQFLEKHKDGIKA